MADRGARHQDAVEGVRVDGGLVVQRADVSTRDLVALAPAWRVLERHSAPNPFLTHAWVDAWWRVFGSDHEPYVLVVQDADAATVGIAPLIRTIVRPAHGVRIATVRFMGYNVSDRLGFLSHSGREHEVSAAIFGYLRRHRMEWQVFEGTNLTDDSPMLSAIRHAFSRDHLVIEETGMSCPYLRIDVDWVSYLQRRSSNFRADLRRSRRRTEHELNAEVRTCSDSEQVREALTFLFRHSIERFRHGAGSSFADPQVQAFHFAVAPSLLRLGRLSLLRIDVDGRTAAVIYDFLHGKTVSFYNAAFDARFAPFKLGAVLLGHAIEDAFARGAHEFDFLLGDYPYKRRWATGSRRHRSVTVVRPRPVAVAIAAVPRWWSRLKQAAAFLLRERRNRSR